MYPGRGSNPYDLLGSQDFKSCVSTNSTTQAGKECAFIQLTLPYGKTKALSEKGL
jgi:hypothetical protein